jgi:hypothetical protein
VAAIALGFCSAVVWGFADFLGGLKSRKLPLLTVMLVSQAAGLAVVAAALIRLRSSPLREGRDVLAAALARGPEAPT